MLLSCNPPPEGIKRIIEASDHHAAKWIKDKSTGEIWYWPAEAAQHASIAKSVGITDYEKGIAITE